MEIQWWKVYIKRYPRVDTQKITWWRKSIKFKPLGFIRKNLDIVEITKNHKFKSMLKYYLILNNLQKLPEIDPACRQGTQGVLFWRRLAGERERGLSASYAVCFLTSLYARRFSTRIVKLTFIFTLTSRFITTLKY